MASWNSPTRLEATAPATKSRECVASLLAYKACATRPAVAESGVVSGRRQRCNACENSKARCGRQWQVRCLVGEVGLVNVTRGYHARH